jgi:hypothetical protein
VTAASLAAIAASAAVCAAAIAACASAPCCLPAVAAEASVAVGAASIEASTAETACCAAVSSSDGGRCSALSNPRQLSTAVATLRARVKSSGGDAKLLSNDCRAAADSALFGSARQSWTDISSAPLLRSTCNQTVLKMSYAHHFTHCTHCISNWHFACDTVDSQVHLLEADSTTTLPTIENPFACLGLCELQVDHVHVSCGLCKDARDSIKDD